MVSAPFINDVPLQNAAEVATQSRVAVSTAAPHVDDPWRLYLSRPGQAYACAHKRISRDESLACGVSSSELGWAFLTCAFAQCRLIGHVPDARKIAADFASAAHHFSAQHDKRGLRLTRLGPAAIAMRMGQWSVALQEFEALIVVDDNYLGRLTTTMLAG